MIFYAYIYRDPRDMRPFYVGKGSGRRVRREASHNAGARKKIKSIKAVGLVPAIEVIEALDESHSFFLESCLIEIFGRRDVGTGSLFNLTDGGEGPSGAVPTEAHRKKLAAVWLGRKHTEETKAKMAVARKLWHEKQGPEYKRLLAARFAPGPITAETRLKMSIASKGRPKSETHRANMAAANRARAAANKK